jgi:hypothetical protein
MIDVDLARAFRAAGLRWHPATGDRFVLDGPEVGEDVYTVSEMTIETHEYATGTVLGFNGTTEWALDSVAAEDALWVPREDQLRELLGSSFTVLTRQESAADGVAYAVSCHIDDVERTFAAPDAATAYGDALLAYITASLAI